jgi:hypothetical protein
MLAEIEHEESGVNARLDCELAALDAEQKTIQSRLSRLADLYVGGDIDRAEYNARKSELIDRKVALIEGRKEIAKGAAGMKFEQMKQPLELVRDWKNASAGGDLLKLRALCAQVGSNWILDSRKVLWDWVSHYAPLARRASYTKWRRGGDSNPRYVLPHTRFPGVHLKPLGHLSVRRDYTKPEHVQRAEPRAPRAGVTRGSAQPTGIQPAWRWYTLFT